MMLRTFYTVLSVALLASAPLIAQDSEAPAEEGATDTSSINTGTPIDPETGRTNGELYEREVSGDWAIRCATIIDDEDPCVMYQLLVDQDGNSVAEIALRPLPANADAAAAGNIVAPLETFLPAQLSLRVDGGGAVRYPYTFCTGRPFSPFLSTGCVSQIGMTNALVDSFKRGAAATITVRPAAERDQDITLTLSLAGFTAAFDALAAE